MMTKQTVFIVLLAASLTNIANAFDHGAAYPIGCPHGWDGLPAGDYREFYDGCRMDQDGELYCEGWKGGDCSELLGHSFLQNADQCEWISVVSPIGKVRFQNEPLQDGSWANPQLYCER